MSKIVLLSLSGGLGNQMMQYDHAKEFSRQNKSELHVDISRLNRRLNSKKITKRKYELDCFSIEISKLSIFQKFTIKLFSFFTNGIYKKRNDFIYKNKNQKYVWIKYHCCDLPVENELFKSYFKFKEEIIPLALKKERDKLKNIQNTVAIYLRKDDWLYQSPKDVVSENCFEEIILKKRN